MRLSELFKGHELLGIWPSISVVVFLIIFVVIVYRVIKYDKSLVKKWENIPFDSSDNSNASSEQNSNS